MRYGNARYVQKSAVAASVRNGGGGCARAPMLELFLCVGGPASGFGTPLEQVKRPERTGMLFCFSGWTAKLRRRNVYSKGGPR